MLHPKSPTRQVRWARHLADDIDPVVIDRLIAGDTAVPHTAFERREAVRILHQRGMPKKRIGHQLRINVRQVHRDLARYGVPTERRDIKLLIERARQRREVVAALVAAGATSCEIHMLLGCRRETVARDRAALGISGPVNQRRARVHAELLRAYGHLFTDEQAVAS